MWVADVIPRELAVYHPIGGGGECSVSCLCVKKIKEITTVGIELKLQECNTKN